MRRLCTESSCSYSGRSVRRGGERGCVESQRGRLAEQGPGAAGAVTRSERSRQRTQRRAQRAAQQCERVIGQKSAEAVLVAEGSTRAGRDEGPNRDTRRSHGQLVRGAEPDRVSHGRRWVMQPALISALAPCTPGGAYRLFLNRPVRTRMPWWCGRGGLKARPDPIRELSSEAPGIVADHR